MKLPKLTQAQSAVVFHLLAVFIVAFAGQLAASATPYANISTLWAGITSGLLAGLYATMRAISQIGSLEAQAKVNRFGLTLKEKTAAYQLLTGFAVMFVGSLGANLATGAAGATSFPDLLAVIVAAISGAAFVVVEYAIGLIPAPKA